ncbi:hypothetical protein ABIC83_003078 [Roseateles asaccharophilus]|uniref:hypothetical protein n=1 Tax=Roseateles asaccharophilus TaxID=582607 RepID=UPI003832E44E
MNSPLPANILDSVSERDRRAIGIRVLRSDISLGELLKRCAGNTPEAQQARIELACALLLAKEDAPEDLSLTDPGLYRVLRDKITEIRMSGWLS